MRARVRYVRTYVRVCVRARVSGDRVEFASARVNLDFRRFNDRVRREYVIGSLLSSRWLLLLLPRHGGEDAP